jgi:TolB-like protein/class 3 adenylate cyclase/tetratricopeptide (TPR) repeat protein
VPPERVERKLAAILAADVAGYSRLMGADEEGTLERLKGHRRELIDPKIAEHRGRIVKTTGDGMLVEFASVVDALRCAVEVQSGMVERNAEVPEEKRIEFRVGINLGDIIIDRDDIHGDGVNIAARLETLAEPGGICVSQTVINHVRGKLPFDVEDAGEQTLKNIAQRVHVFRVILGAGHGQKAPPPPKPALALPDKPSIAVLPFNNLSGDPEQDYFADGIVEDIITALSRVHWLFVIARNSSFTYRGKTVDVKQVGRELGVRYVLEGSVRKASNRVRISGQLIDALTGAHVWADHFDGVLDDIFDLQDRVTASVVGIIEPKLRNVEIERARRKPTESLDAYDLYLRALAQIIVSYEGNLEALKLLSRAIEIDPKYAAPYGLAAWCYLHQKMRGWVPPSDPALAKGIRMAKLAASLGKDDPETLWMAGTALAMTSGDLQGGIALIDRALTLNPNSANAWYHSGMVRAYLGDTETAIAHLERSVRLSPLDTSAYFCSLGFVYAHFMPGRYEEASAWCDKMLHEAPDYPSALRMKAATCGLLGRLDDGRVWVERLLAVNPDSTVSSMRLLYGVFMKKPGCLEAFLDGLRKAGLPE